MADPGEQFWIDRAQSAEAKLATLKANMDPVIDRVKQFKANFGIRESSDGSIDVDFDKFVERLGVEACLELRHIIDEKFGISGVVGEKPRIRVRATQ